MTDDLVKRLRQRVAMTDRPWATCPALCTEAADRIEQLEAGMNHTQNVMEMQAREIDRLRIALRKITQTPPFGEPQEIARAALEGGNG